MDPADRAIIERSQPSRSPGRPASCRVIDSVRYCVARGIPGEFAECGVWRGGSMLAMVLTLRDIGVEDRDIYLFDTFTGMTEPGQHDVSRHDPPAVETWQEAREATPRPGTSSSTPTSFNVEAVAADVMASGYPAERLHFVEGAVEQTIPAQAPSELALLRLDTDWYESTRHELVTLYPRLAPAGCSSSTTTATGTAPAGRSTSTSPARRRRCC